LSDGGDFEAVMAAQSGTTEAALIERARYDREAFGLIYEQYVDRIYNYIYYRTGNAADAEDLTARTFMRAMQHIATYEDQGVPFSAWLYRIAHNLVANWHRDRNRRQIISLDDLTRWHVHEDGLEAAALKIEDKAALLEAVRRLPTDRQELLALKFVEQLSNAEIGAVMGRSEGAIKSLYHRTLLSLREELSPEAVSPSLTSRLGSQRLRKLLSRVSKRRNQER
jgi:RNA polymerase sigma-70 factor (ECF subfamily)